MGRAMAGSGGAIALLAITCAMAGGASAATSPGLPQPASGHRPGPDALYAPAADAPQLQNVAPWAAPPILVSSGIAYREGEWLYQDFLNDDRGAAGVPDPSDPHDVGSFLFSPKAGTLTYPTDPAFANNAADLVELRVKPLPDATAFRVTLNTLVDPERTAFTIALASPGAAVAAWPHGAGVSSPATFFLTVHGGTAELRDAAGSTLAPAPTATVDAKRRQVDVRVPHAQFAPGSGRVGVTVGVGLWDVAKSEYLAPGTEATDDRSRRGGARRRPSVQRRPAGRRAVPRRLAVRCRCDDRRRGRGRHGRRFVVAREAAGGSPAVRRRLRVRPGGRFRSPGAVRERRLAGPQDRPDEPHPRQRSQPRTGHRPHEGVLRPAERVRRRGEVRRPDGRTAAAVLRVRAEEDAARRRLGNDAPAALAERQLQPVLELQEPIPGRRPRRRVRSSRHQPAAVRTASTAVSPRRTRSRCGPTSRATTRWIRSTSPSPGTRWAASAPSASSRAGRTCSPADGAWWARRAASPTSCESLRNTPLMTWSAAADELVQHRDQRAGRDRPHGREGQVRPPAVPDRRPPLARHQRRVRARRRVARRPPGRP